MPRPAPRPESAAEPGDRGPASDPPADDSIIGRALVRSLALATAVGLVVLVATLARRPRPPRPAAVQAPVAIPARRLQPPVTIPPMPFTDITAAAGVRFVHENGAEGEKLLPETMGAGCGFVDLDGDGDQDLVFVSGAAWPWSDPAAGAPATAALYRNDGSGRFEDVTAGSGLDTPLYGTGLAAGDIDGDGLTDLFVAGVGPNRLYRNLGDCRFADVTAEAGVAGAPEDWSTSAGFCDLDGDGDLDLFVCTYVIWSRELDRSQDFQLVGGGRAYGRPQNFAGTFPRLYRNDGGGRFTDVSSEAGIQVANPATGLPMAKSLGVAFDDLDDDGFVDILVANDTVQNLLFRNRGNGTFEEIGAPAGIAFDPEGKARGAMGIDIARFRNDADVGVVIGNFANEMTALYVARGGQLQFKDDAVSSGLGPPTRLELTFGILFADVDLDGRLDILAANGHLEEDIGRVQTTQAYRQPPRLYWNCGREHATEFLPVPAANVGEDFSRPLVGRSLASADIDGDGDLDCVITASGAPPRLLRNDQSLGSHWLRVRLEGAGPNPEAIGAVVELRTRMPDGSETDGVQTRFVSPTRGYQSQSELPVTFGLGPSPSGRTPSCTVRVRWPDGSTTTHADLAPDRLHVIAQRPGRSGEATANAAGPLADRGGAPPRP
jgi:hypothetical protein